MKGHLALEAVVLAALEEAARRDVAAEPRAPAVDGQAGRTVEKHALRVPGEGGGDGDGEGGGEGGGVARARVRARVRLRLRLRPRLRPRLRAEAEAEA